ncbi:MAG: nuclear transport factor 2 family protein [Gammaproteobacteria bacterium]|nr:nuclear transport factor 2 family protein [Gammaproteobacteria bacterium]
MNRDTFMTYIDRFNQADLEGLRPFWAPDVELRLPGVPPRQLRGPDEIVRTYRQSFGFIHERLRIDYLAIDGDRIAAEMYTEFAAHCDHPGFRARPLRKGDVYVMTNFVHYELKNDLFWRIRVAGYTQDASRCAPPA